MYTIAIMATIPATQLKRRVSDVLDAVYFKKEIAVIERYGKPIAKIIPYADAHDRAHDVTATLNKYFGALPDFPDVRETRTFRQRAIRL